ncbi:DUF2147 domain-containing protein [Novosphingobium sp.]|uniref:DUF2147 domain-containing protein n=1 Tax=Novosphingobium sp. TaxID=1874826 RepID=UPI0038BD5CEA
MKVFPSLVAISLSLAGAAPVAAKPEDAIGRWATATRHGVVEITACGSSICGRLVDSENLRTNPDMRDFRNKAAEQRNRPIKGLLMLSGFTRSANGWDGGSVYNPEDGGTYSGTITIGDADTLKLKGCIVWPLCKSQVWKRIR